MKLVQASQEWTKDAREQGRLRSHENTRACLYPSKKRRIGSLYLQDEAVDRTHAVPVLCRNEVCSRYCKIVKKAMTKQEFLSSMENLLEVPSGTLAGGEKLDDLEGWNSLAMVEYIALADRNGGKASPRQIRECETVNDLARLARVE